MLAFLSFMIHSVGVCLAAQLCLTLLLCPWRSSRQENWNGLPCPPPGDLPNPETEPRSPALQADSLPSEPPGKLIFLKWKSNKICAICCIHMTLLMWCLLRHLYEDWIICSLWPGGWIWNKNLKVFLKCYFPVSFLIKRKK